MKSSILLLFLSLKPSLILSFDCNVLDSKLKKTISKISAPLEGVIKKKLLSLEKEAGHLKNGASWKKISQKLESLKKMEECASINKGQEALNLLNALENCSRFQTQSKLLDAISSLLQSTPALESSCKSFFLKERARLMDGADEVIILKAKQATILDLKTSFLKKLQEDLEKIKSLELYRALQKDHQKYLSDKKTKK